MSFGSFTRCKKAITDGTADAVIVDEIARKYSGDALLLTQMG